MWLVRQAKQAAQRVKELSVQVLREKSEAERLAEDVVSNRHQVMPVRQMGELAALSFEMQAFQQTFDFISGKLKDIKFERKSLKKRLNLLVLATYLVKHGASGFIDQFRALSPELRRYQTLRNFVAEEDPQMRRTMQELHDRAEYLLVLLEDKVALMREKEVARLVREKLFLQGGDYTSRHQRQGDEGQGQSGGNGDRVEAFLEHYVWRYTQKLDRKLDQITDILIAKIDEYLDGEIPENFEIDEAEGIASKPSFTKSEFELGGESTKREEARFIDAKLQAREEKIEEDLLELEPPKRLPPADLLVFSKEPQQKEAKQGKENQSEQLNKPLMVDAKAMQDDEIQAFRSELSEPSPTH